MSDTGEATTREGGLERRHARARLLTSAKQCARYGGEWAAWLDDPENAGDLAAVSERDVEAIIALVWRPMCT